MEASAALASRAIGAGFFTIFGAIWLGIWSHRSYGWQPAILALIAVVAGAILVAAWRQYQANRLAHETQAETPERKAAARIFNIVNVTQWVLILVVGNVLANIGLGDWVLAAAMLIIGLHFFPLAKAFQNPQLVWTGAALSVVAIVYPFVVPGGPANPLGCLAAGLILWASAVRALVAKPL